jgi:hypothetical protein
VAGGAPPPMRINPKVAELSCPPGVGVNGPRLKWKASE